MFMLESVKSIIVSINGVYAFHNDVDVQIFCAMKIIF